MRTIDVDARRYAWCRGHALWRMGLPLVAHLEDIDGALDEGQDRLVRYTARRVGQNCAVVLALRLHYERPIPATRVHASWALARVGDHELGAECAALIRGSDDCSPAELAERCRGLVQRVREVVGEVPDPLTPEGYFPALALAREWLQLAEAVGEEGFLPREWTGGGNG